MKKVSPRIREFAKRALQRKLSLEKTISNDLRAYFNDVSKSVFLNGVMPSVIFIIVKHNIRVANKLIRTGKLTELRTQLIDHAVNNNYHKLVPTHWKSIDQYTKELIARSKEVARELLTDKKTDEKGNVIALEYKADAATLNKTAAKVLSNYNKNRIQGIAITETNTLYESANNDMFDQLQDDVDAAIDDNDQEFLDSLDDIYDSLTFDEVRQGMSQGVDKHELRAVVIQANQVWVTAGDDKVRDAHAEAEGQTVPVGDPFIIDGYEMEYPGDDSAPIELWVNCRCSVAR
jgi:hypothetical protein